jgi:hypothetical protein
MEISEAQQLMPVNVSQATVKALLAKGMIVPERKFYLIRGIKYEYKIK